MKLNSSQNSNVSESAQKKKLSLTYWISSGISVIFLYLFLRKVDFNALVNALYGANYIYLIPAITINFLMYLVRAKRWKYLLEPIHSATAKNLFSSTVIGFAVNHILPARMGEFVRAYAIGQKERISKSSAFATIVIERIFDGTIVILFVILVLLFPPFSSDVTVSRLKGAGIILMLIFGGGLLFLLFLKHYTLTALKAVRVILNPLPKRFSTKAFLLIDSFIAGLDVLSKGKHLFIVFIYSVILWLLGAAGIQILYPAFYITEASFMGSIFVLILIAIAVMIPSAPSYIGTFHFASASGLILLGVDSNVARSFTLILWTVNIIPITLLGLFYIWRGGLSLKEIKTYGAPQKIL